METEEKTAEQTSQTAETQEQSAVETEAKEEATQTEEKAESEESKAEPEAKENRTREERERDSMFAKMRRENERLKSENEKLQQKAQKSISDTALKELGLTKDDLSDADNMSLAEAYMEGTRNGEENPKAFAYASVFKEKKATEKAQRAEEDAQKAQQEAQDKMIAEASTAFRKAYGNEELERIMNADSDFFKHYGKALMKHPDMLVDYYEIWKPSSDSAQKAETEKAKNDGAIPSGNYSGKNKGVEYYRNLPRSEVLKLNDTELHKWADANGIRLRY